MDERAVRIVELRFFAGLEMAEVARALELSLPTVERGWPTSRRIAGERSKACALESTREMTCSRNDGLLSWYSISK